MNGSVMGNIAKEAGKNSFFDVIKWMCVIVLFAMAHDASAACTSNPETLTVTFPSSLSFPRDLPIGGVIATANASAHTFGKGVHCDGVGTYNTQNFSAIPGVTISDDKNTAIIGDGSVGIQFFSAAGTLRKFERGTVTLTTAICPTGSCTFWTSIGAVKLIKLKTVVTQSSFTSGNDAFQYWVDGQLGVKVNINNLTFAPQTCQVTTPNVAVNLTPSTGLLARTFTGVGTASTAVPFNIGVNCSGVAAKVFMTVTDQQTPTNTSSTLNLSRSATATGLGIQILNGASPISFGPDSSAAGTTNQFSVFTADGTATTPTLVNLSARYIQTSATVTPGSAGGVATFIMSYQ